MMFCKNTKVMVHSPNGDTELFDIVTGILLDVHKYYVCL